MKTHKLIPKFAILAGATTLTGTALASTDYGPALWRPTCNANYYTSGNGHKFCVIHDMEGYYLSTVSYLTSCSHTSSSVHYAVNGLTDSSDNGAAPGEITQMVRDSQYAWHAICWNQYSFGTEHEGFESNPAWYTTAMYSASGALQSHLCAAAGIAKDRNHIVAHGEKSNANWVAYCNANFGCSATCNTHTDPGPYWNWTTFMSYINPPPPPPSFIPSAGARIKGDFNGDGREDVAIAYNYGNSETGLFIATSTGSGFASPARWWDSGAGNFDATRCQWVAGDFNGDGKTDIACLYNYGGGHIALFVFRSTGSGLALPVCWWSASSGWDGTRCSLVAGDFNSDGKTDLAIAFDYGSSETGLWIFSSTGSGFTAPARWWDSGVGNWDATRCQWVTGDLNGNGKTDITCLYNYGGGHIALFAFVSTGSGLASPVCWWSASSGWEGTRCTLMAADFNGDGKKDIGIAYDYGNSETGLWVSLSTGSGLAAPARWWDSGIGNWVAANTQWVAGDFTGDGKADVGALYNYGGSTTALFVIPSTGSAFSASAQWWRSNAGTWDWTRSILF